MSYAKEKKKIDRKRKKVKRWLFSVFVVVLVALAVFSAYVPPRTWQYRLSLPKTSVRKAGEMRIHFIDVGQGDATLIELPEGKTMLIDGGDDCAEATRALLRYLNALKIDCLDYLVVTYADIDHYGALSTLLEQKSVKRAFLPAVESTLNTQYANFYAKLLENGATREYSMRGVDLSVTDGETPYRLTFLYPYIYDVREDELSKVADDNAASAIVWLDYKGTSALFTGDAPTATENALMRDENLGLFENTGVELSSTEILKVAHHGSNHSTSSAFVRFLGVKEAVISCGEGNDYGHPSAEVMQTLSSLNVNVYRTDERGSTIFTLSQNGEYAVKTLG